jgi:hypothetical protein
LRLGHGEAASITEESVCFTLGIRLGGKTQIRRLRSRPRRSQLKAARRNIGARDSLEIITVRELIDILQRPLVNDVISRKEIINIQCSFVMLCCAVFFSPRQERSHVPKEAYEAVRLRDRLCDLDFGQYIVSELLEGAKRLQLDAEGRKGKTWVYGCLIYLQVDTK